jgi:SEC-C motif domain protein
MNEGCPCGSKKSFADCCGRFLDAGENPRTPEQLMRSRYSAYCLGHYGEYLVRTWLTAVELGYSAADFNKEPEQKVRWQKLEIVKSTQKGNLGTVEFKAYFVESNSLSFVKGEGRGEDLQKGGRGEDLKVHHERSLFKRIDGRWFYVEPLSS